MIYNLKYFKLIILLFVYTNTNGQDSLSDVTKNWTKLKIQFEKRADILTKFANELSKSAMADKQNLNELKSASIEFIHYIDQLNTEDSISLASAQLKNKHLNETIMKTLIQVENTKLRTSSIYVNLQAQLEGCENRIALANREYNETCIKYNRKDLMFYSKQIDKAPEVHF